MAVSLGGIIDRHLGVAIFPRPPAQAGATRDQRGAEVLVVGSEFSICFCGHVVLSCVEYTQLDTQLSTLYEKNMQLFSSRLIGARNALRITQGDLAAQVGVSLRSIQNWEAGKFAPRAEDLRNLSAALGVTVAYLTGDVETSEADNVRTKAHHHVDRVFDACAGDTEQMTWTYVELQRRFPVREGDATERYHVQAHPSAVNDRAGAAGRMMGKHQPSSDEEAEAQNERAEARHKGR